MKGLILLPVGILALGGYVYAGSHFANSAQKSYANIKGNGKLKTENRTVAPYTKVVIGSAFEGQFFETTPGPLTISAESNILPLIETKVQNGTLYVTTKGSMSTQKGFRITGRTTKISHFDASGASKIELKNIGNHPLELKASGASTLNIFGKPSSLNVDASGASKVKLGLLNLDSLVAEISGASELSLSGRAKTASINASGDKFKGVAAGASNIEVNGRFTSSSATSTGASSISKPSN